MAIAHAELQFIGYVSAASSSRFALYDTESKTSRWLGVGEEFVGHRIVVFNPEKLTLTVVGAGQNRVLTLVDNGIGGNEPATEERDKGFATSVGDMIRKLSTPGRDIVRPTIEDLIAEAQKFGREIVHRDTKDGHEVIIMDVRDEPRSRSRVFNYSVSLSPRKRGEPKRTLILH